MTPASSDDGKDRDDARFQSLHVVAHNNERPAHTTLFSNCPIQWKSGAIWNRFQPRIPPQAQVELRWTPKTRQLVKVEPCP